MLSDIGLFWLQARRRKGAGNKKVRLFGRTCLLSARAKRRTL
jgi:hypothetical protein